MGILSALLSLAAGTSAAEVRLVNTTGSDTFERPVKYAIYLPPGYDADNRNYPVVYLLHGGGSGQPRVRTGYRVDDRRVLSGIIFISCNGLRWSDAPAAYGLPKTLYMEP